MSTNAMRRARPQGSWVSMWIEKYCQRPNGKFVLLTFTQKETIRQIYDSKNGTGPDDFGPLIERELRTYLALVHICGIKAQRGQPVPANLSGIPRSQSGLLPDHR